MDPFQLPLLGKVFRKFVVFLEGGMMVSKTARKIHKRIHNVDIGMYSYGGCFSDDFNSGGKVKIGRYCSIAMNVHYLAGNHPVTYVSTSPYFFQKYLAKKEVKDIKRTSLYIGNDVWIGYGTIITPGCSRIGNGAIIGAGSVVTKDIPSYSIVAGNPARVIRYRFSKEEQDLIENSLWWKNTPKELLKYYNYITDVGKFAKSIRSH